MRKPKALHSITLTWQDGRTETIPATYADVSRLIERLRTSAAHMARKTGECVDCGAPITGVIPHRHRRVRCDLCWYEDHQRRHSQYIRDRKDKALPALTFDDIRCCDCGQVYTRDTRKGPVSPRCPGCRKERARVKRNARQRELRRIQLDSWFTRQHRSVAPTSTVTGLQSLQEIGPAVGEIVAAGERQRSDAA